MEYDRRSTHQIHPWYFYAECGCPHCLKVLRVVERRERRGQKQRFGWKSKRERIYKRDGNSCLKCGATEDLTLDHILPRALGGTNHDHNLQTLCKPCNNEKGMRIVLYRVDIPSHEMVRIQSLIDRFGRRDGSLLG